MGCVVVIVVEDDTDLIVKKLRVIVCALVEEIHVQSQGFLSDSDTEVWINSGHLLNTIKHIF